MVTKNSGCYYEVHFGCLNAALDAHCHRCAQRLTNAVNYVLHSGVNDTDASRTWTAPYAGGVAEAPEEKMASSHFAGDHDVWREPSYRTSNGACGINAEPCTKLLSEFGLGEKEAQVYVHLLKYGPKRAGDLARSLKTYREDAYRRCARLIDAGVIVKSAGDSSRYAPVDLDEALDAALMSRQRELRRLQRVKHELVGDTNGALSRGADNVHVFKMLKTVGELVAAISQLINSAETSVVFVAHPQFNLITMRGFLDHLKCAVGRGVRVRGVLDISLQNLSAGREYLEGCIELRHTNLYRGMTLIVADGKRSISLIHAALKAALSLDENVAALWSDSVAQAEFLVSAFEMAWERASGAEERMTSC